MIRDDLPMYMVRMNVPSPGECTYPKICHLFAGSTEKCTLLSLEELNASSVEVCPTIIDRKISQHFACPQIQKEQSILFGNEAIVTKRILDQ